MAQTKVSVRGQTVIPREIREKFDIHPDTTLSWSIQNGVIVVVPLPQDPVEASVGLLKGRGFTFEDIMEDLRRDHYLERKRDQRLMQPEKREREANG